MYAVRLHDKPVKVQVSTTLALVTICVYSYKIYGYIHIHTL